MKRLLPFIIIALAIGAYLLRDKILPPAPGQNAWLGAVDAKLTLVGPLAAGRITAVKIEKGSDVKAGDVLFTLDDAAAKAQAQQAEAALNTAQQNLKDLQSGKRPDEMAIYDQQLAEATANLTLARENYVRADSLNNHGITSEATFDSAKAAQAVAESRIAQIEANKKAAELPAREASISAAQSRVKEAEAALAQANAKLADYSIKAAIAAHVDDVFFNAGEAVGAGQPIVSLLPSDALVLRFFVPETARAKLQPGTKIHFRCDSCANEFAASISHVFANPEYTPPVIYSENARGKLVYQVEAKIENATAQLQPGLPVQVVPLP